MKGLNGNLRSDNRFFRLVFVFGLHCMGGNLPVCTVLIWLDEIAWHCAIAAACVASSALQYHVLKYSWAIIIGAQAANGITIAEICWCLLFAAVAPKHIMHALVHDVHCDM